MKSSLPKRRIRPIRAKAATAEEATWEEYGPEPNMKLSHAFLVVLALHVIAVGGLFAFNKVKAHHAFSSVKIKTESNPESATEMASEAAPLTAQGAEKNVVSSHANAGAAVPLHAATASSATPVAPAPSTASSATTPISSTGGPGGTPPPTPSVPPTPAAPLTSASAPTDTASPTAEATPTAPAVTEYTVVKGDNPYNIAKRFHVSYDSLMKLNNITDPRKIQIGQKLLIPAPLPTVPHKASTAASHQASVATPHKIAKKKAKKKS